ncbi:MAG: sulfatase-like hydrolase/transferase, partial [bacterium]|nr:sulfatase-like hydrolase/transferase [bacterium]
KKIKRYDSEIGFSDFHIGKLVARLKELGVYEDSLIVFLADHGESFGEHNYLKHGRKLYNSTVHVPLIVKLPGNLLKNTRRHGNVSLLDVAPTMLSALNFKKGKQMEGLALLDEENEGISRKILLETYGGSVVLRRKSKKYHLKVKPIRYGIIEGNTKVVYGFKNKKYEAYHMDNDFFELNNVFHSEHLSEDDLTLMLGDRTKKILSFIKSNRSFRLGQGQISREDLDALKSLGYVD